MSKKAERKRSKKSRRTEQQQKKIDTTEKLTMCIGWVTFYQSHRDRRCERGWHAIVRLHTRLVIDGHGLFQQAFNVLLSYFYF